MRKVATPLFFTEQVAPSTPPSGFVALYTKADGFFYAMSDGGTESRVSRIFIDDDTFATATATNYPSAESTKAYVDAHAAAADPHAGYVLESLADAVGDQLVASADNVWAKLTKGAQGTHQIVDTDEALDIKYVSAVDRQTFSASGTWTKPANVSPNSVSLVRVIGGGGGAGGGRVAAAGTAHGGGGGGGAGGYSETFIATELLGATETVTIGTGGAGGGGGAQPTNNGVPGAAGLQSSFGTWVVGGVGAGGIGGTTAGGVGGGTGATTQGSVPVAASALAGATMQGNQGGNGSVGAGYPVPPGGYNLFGAAAGNMNPGGGGGGGGITSGGAVETGANGGHGSLGAKAGGAGGSGATAGAVGTAGAIGGGGGGGGSGSRVDATGAFGGAGGAPGGGGGGGGATSGAFNAGTGGAGAAGYCEVITWL